MEDKLKDFIGRNRDAFELEQMPAFSAISQSVKPIKTKKIKLSNYKTMIKYGFGASAVVIGTVLTVYALQSEKEIAGKNKREISLEIPKSETAPVALKEADEKMNQTKNTFVAFQNHDSVFSNSAPPDSVPTAKDALPSPPPLPLAPPDTNAIISSGTPDLLAQTDTFFRDIKQIKVKAKFCKVQMKGTTSAETHLKANFPEGSGSMVMLGTKCYVKSLFELQYTIEGTVLNITVEEIQLPKRRAIKQAHQDAYISLDLPAGITVEVENESGSITAENLNAKAFKFYAHFGSLSLQNINAQLDLKAKSGNTKCFNIVGDVKSTGDFGSQTFDGIKGNLTIVCNSGNIKINNLAGDADVQTSFGTQQYNSINGNIKALTSSGSIKMYSVKGAVDCVSSFGNLVFDDVVGDLSAQASSGSIRMNKINGALQLNTSFGNIKGDQITLINKAVLKASSGSINIDFLNEVTELQFDLTASSGKISVEDQGQTKQAEHNLKYGVGSISVTALTTFGNQNFR